MGNTIDQLVAPTKLELNQSQSAILLKLSASDFPQNVETARTFTAPGKERDVKRLACQRKLRHPYRHTLPNQKWPRSREEPSLPTFRLPFWAASWLVPRALQTKLIHSFKACRGCLSKTRVTPRRHQVPSFASTKCQQGLSAPSSTRLTGSNCRRAGLRALKNGALAVGEGSENDGSMSVFIITNNMGPHFPVLL